ncbi:MAG: hypothetical protein Q8L20_11050 [Gammaproteobacteria bacterium]|nr:hypothetical protein [Gammaproteobacteria bacterium]
MGSCEYVREYYKVPAEIGRRVIVNGKLGVIAEDRGNYIGVNFDADKPGVINNCHPTWQVVYGEMGPIRKMTRSQQRYERYREYSDCFDSFRDFLAWDSEPEREWNRRW